MQSSFSNLPAGELSKLKQLSIMYVFCNLNITEQWTYMYMDHKIHDPQGSSKANTFEPGLRWGASRKIVEVVPK